MPEGWRITLEEAGHKRHFLVGIADRDAAIGLVTGGRRGKSDIISAEPMSKDEVERLALTDGRFIEASDMG